MPDAATLLAAYDAQLRTDAETPSALAVARVGPLRLVTFAGGRGLVTYRSLDAADGTPVDAGRVRELVGAAADHFRADPTFARVEWKTRGHDHAPGLHDALLEHGFEPEEPESIMLGEAAGLVAHVPLPGGVTLRRVTAEADVRAMALMVDEVFGGPQSAEPILARLRRESVREDGMQVWVAESDGVVVGAGRLEPVPGTEFAGIWGGATRPEWRGQGIYRALTAARAREALRLGRRYLHSDSTEFSRPILERGGLVKASTTTPYTWHR